MTADSHARRIHLFRWRDGSPDGDREFRMWRGVRGIVALTSQ